MISSRVTVAAIQLSSQLAVEANLAEAEPQVARAAERGASLVLLPENFAFFGNDDDRRHQAEPLWGQAETKRCPIQAELARWARRYAITLIAGGFPTLSDDPARPHNTCLVLSPEGERLAHYHKIHLFDVELSDGTSLAESRGTKPGAEPAVVDAGGLQVGLSICYDLRFPELYRQLVRAGAQLLVVPAAFTLHTGKDHWEVLLRARAIENQVWVLAAGQYGANGPKRRSYGHSLLVDPWGQVVARSSDGVGMALGEVSLEYTQQVRKGLPALRHCRL